PRRISATFLSCLYGSEPAFVGQPIAQPFLSCLYGSERGYSVTKFDRIFLSCLYGSEHLFLLVGGLESISKLPVRQ
ncbi:hypothetical protein, partial [Escherichia coli]|uniref:hypothetical protein n=3 Tax=Escherichia coli TaxID=562 RepID=UPI003B286B8B